VGIWSDLWISESKDWAFSRVGGWSAGPVIQPKKSYVSVMIRQLHVVHVRIGFNRFYGTVQSYARLPHMSGRPVEFTAMTTPAQLRDVQKKNLDRFVLSGQRLLGPVPFMGGDLELEIGLFSVKSQDMLKPYLDLLDELSKAAGVSVFSVAAPYIAPLKRGVELLTAAEGGATLEIGVTATFDTLREGTYFAARLDSASRDMSKFEVDDNCRLLDERGNPIKDAPYIVFSIDQHSTRDDWFMIPSIASAYAKLNDVVRSPRSSLKLVSSHQERFNGVVMDDPDILPDHADDIISWVSEQLSRKLPAVKTSGGGVGAALPPLNELKLRDLREGQTA
jgi:hypothetical protein